MNGFLRKPCWHYSSRSDGFGMAANVEADAGTSRLRGLLLYSLSRWEIDCAGRKVQRNRWAYIGLPAKWQRKFWRSCPTRYLGDMDVLLSQIRRSAAQSISKLASAKPKRKLALLLTPLRNPTAQFLYPLIPLIPLYEPTLPQ
jgi:hypothetical protein